MISGPRVRQTLCMWYQTLQPVGRSIIWNSLKKRDKTKKNLLLHPNPSVADVEDILALFDKLDSDGSRELPRFVTDSYKALPPASGFDAVAVVLCALRDEVTALRTEVSELRHVVQKDSRTVDTVQCIV